MSKRYGRSQKRRARAEIEALREALQMANALAEHLGRRVGSLEDEIARAKCIAGQYSALFDPVPAAIDGPVRSFVQMAVYPQLTPRHLGDPFPEIRHVRLETLLMSVEQDALRRMVHAYVQFADRQVCYAASREAINAVPKSELIQRISTAIAAQLGRKLRDAPGAPQ